MASEWFPDKWKQFVFKINKEGTFTKEKVFMSKFRKPIQTVMSGGQI